MRRSVRATVAVLAAIAAGCGGSGGSGGNGGARTGRGPVTTAGRSVAAAPGSTEPTLAVDAVPSEAASSTTTHPTTGGALAPASEASTTTTVSRVVAIADHTCVHPGDPQGLTVRAVDPGTFVSYDTVYSDHSDQLSGRYPSGSGSGYGKADAGGGFHATWVVPANAPAGPAVIDVGANKGHRLAEVGATFTVEPAVRACS